MVYFEGSSGQLSDLICHKTTTHLTFTGTTIKLLQITMQIGAKGGTI